MGNAIARAYYTSRQALINSKADTIKAVVVLVEQSLKLLQISYCANLNYVHVAVYSIIKS